MTNNEDDWLARQREEQEQEALKISYVKTRLAACKVCEHYWKEVKVCKQCYCFIPAKAMIQGATCPVGKW